MTQANEPIPGLDNARSWWTNIVEMLEALEVAEEQALTGDDEARERILESILSVEVRSGWHTPDDEDGDTPAEYRILLTTGGPALQIVGDLDEYGEPETAKLQSQDWFKPWTDVPAQALLPDTKDDQPISLDEQVTATLLTFVQCFYFGS
jgi:hypothetical protein